MRTFLKRVRAFPLMATTHRSIEFDSPAGPAYGCVRLSMRTIRALPHSEDRNPTTGIVGEQRHDINRNRNDRK
jgi:hypothetical protein